MSPTTVITARTVNWCVLWTELRLWKAVDLAETAGIEDQEDGVEMKVKGSDGLA
jgi:hypothetical protein